MNSAVKAGLLALLAVAIVSGFFALAFEPAMTGQDPSLRAGLRVYGGIAWVAAFLWMLFHGWHSGLASFPATFRAAKISRATNPVRYWLLLLIYIALSAGSIRYLARQIELLREVHDK